MVVRTNLEEGRWLAGLSEGGDAEAAAEAIVALGARIAVVTRGEDGAVMRGAARGEHPGLRIDLVSPLGAGDAFMGTLAAGLEQRGFDPARAAETLGPACEAAARACTVWQAVP
jgi:fructokinase